MATATEMMEVDTSKPKNAKLCVNQIILAFRGINQRSTGPL